MKTKRISIALHMLFLALNKGGFSHDEIRQVYTCSRASLYRALSDVRCYLQEQCPYFELVFVAETNDYRLIKTL